MNHPPPQPVNLAAFHRAAVGLSRIYIAIFAAFCGIVAWLDGPSLGWWWITFLIAGFFLVPVLFVAPMTAISLLLGARAGVDPYTSGGRMVYLAVDLCGYLALWLTTRWSLNALDRWLEVI